MPPPIDTVTGVFAATAASAVAVTVTDVDPASSLTLDGFTDSVTDVADGARSSSVSVNVVPLTLRPEALPDTEIVSSPSTDASWVGVSVNVPVPLVESALIVTVKSDTDP